MRGKKSVGLRLALAAVMALVAALFCPFDARAADDGGSPAQAVATSPSPPVGLQRVAVGVYINQIYELSLKDNHLVVDFWVWFRWQADGLKPYETFEVKNGRIESKGEPTFKKLGETSYAYVRVVADVTHFWDVSGYPLDAHVVPIAIEDSHGEESELVYVPDAEASGMDDDVQVVSFVASAGKARVETASYHTNYGDTSVSSKNETRYSRFVLPMEFRREGVRYFIKLFVGLFIAVAIAFLAFFIKPTEVDPRFGLGVGAIFAAVGSEYVVTGALAESATMSLADKLHIIAFVAIFVSLAQSAISLHWYSNDQEERSRRFDKRSLVVVSLGYLLMSLAAIVTR